MPAPLSGLDIIEAHLRSALEEVEEAKAPGGAGTLCAHVDPLVIDGQTAWCADCGGLFGMGAWRLPNGGA